ncbi:hypothetical protein MAP00_000825 [Monascus purpureus]|nr:hypothetical protein MAP00_000825 [Monascus purpureus]
MSQITHVVLDKTGTLTKGQLSISRLRLLDPLHKMTTDHLVWCAAERDSHLSHPVGRAVFQWASSQLDGTREYVTQYADSADRGRELALQEHTQTVHFAIDDSYIGLLCIEDSIWSESANLVRQLQRQGLMVSILTGDEE